jgi:hypothetical protein
MMLVMVDNLVESLSQWQINRNGHSAGVGWAETTVMHQIATKYQIAGRHKI